MPRLRRARLALRARGAALVLRGLRLVRSHAFAVRIALALLLGPWLLGAWLWYVIVVMAWFGVRLAE